MSTDKKNRVRLWLYAVVLFTSAFVVLLITAYSQIKFNRNIDDYRKQIYSEEKEKNRFLLNLNSALEENLKLAGEIKALKEQIKGLKDKAGGMEGKNLELQSKYDNILSTYEKLAEAQNEYNSGNVIACAEILKNKINTGYLDSKGLQMYNSLVEKTYPGASHELYLKGNEAYRNKKYEDAIEYLRKSLLLSDSEYYSDDCYFLLAHSEYRLGDKESAAIFAEALIRKYPKSSLTDESRDLLVLLGQ